MHDFDSARKARHEERERLLGDRSFTFGGETFSYRANVHYDVIRRVAEMTETEGSRSVFTLLEEAVLDMLDPDNEALARFRRVCARDAEIVVTWDDLTELANWLIEKATNRPPTPPEPSHGSSTISGTGSTAISSTEPAAA